MTGWPDALTVITLRDRQLRLHRQAFSRPKTIVTDHARCSYRTTCINARLGPVRSSATSVLATAISTAPVRLHSTRATTSPQAAARMHAAGSATGRPSRSVPPESKQQTRCRPTRHGTTNGTAPPTLVHRIEHVDGQHRPTNRQRCHRADSGQRKPHRFGYTNGHMTTVCRVPAIPVASPWPTGSGILPANHRLSRIDHAHTQI